MSRHATRRNLLTTCSLAGGGIVARSLAAQVSAPSALAMRVLVIGAHPGDPEAGCGGIMARYAKLGHEVTALYLTRGEGGVSGKSAEQAAAIRSAEVETACKIL